MTYHVVAQSGAPVPLDLPRAIAEACRRVSTSAIDLSQRERQLLRDFRRALGGDVRYHLRTLEQLLTISARCEDVGHRFAIAEACRGYTAQLAPRPQLTVLEAFALETRSNERANNAQLLYAWERTPAFRELAIETLGEQEGATRIALDVLHTHHPQDLTRKPASVYAAR